MPNADELLRKRIGKLICETDNFSGDFGLLTAKIMIEIENEIAHWRNINFETCSPLNEYHKGMCNGMEFIRSLIACDEPKYL